MKITYNWLRDFVDIKISPQKLSHLLTMAGLEVVSLEKKEDDWILELEITSNRSDCLSVIGIAREVAAITNKRLKLSSVYRLPFTVYRNQPFSIKIENERDCPLYTARLINNVKVRTSPEGLKRRLENVGIRSVNNIVDITNYVLIETGQPLHAFDYDRLKEHRIIVRRAKDKEKIINIDGIERELNEDTLVISDGRCAVAIAGIMGSKDTEVTKDTKNILLESAEFNPLIVRRGRRYLGLVTESSYRFERGVNKSNVIFASERAKDLIEEIAKGESASFKIKGSLKEKERIIFLNKENVKKTLGKRIPLSEIKRILRDLRFQILEREDKLDPVRNTTKLEKDKISNGVEVSIPSFRKDIKEEIDLIEEIARIKGYDNIPLTLPYIKVSTSKESIQDLIKYRIKSSLLKTGLNEVITYSLLPPENLIEKETVRIANPISKETSVLRPNLLFSLLKVLQYNVNRGADSLGIFELAKTYKYEKIPKEADVLGILVFGEFYSDWLRNQRLNYSFFDLKGIIGVVLNNLGIEDYDFKSKEIPYLDQSAIFGLNPVRNIILSDGKSKISNGVKENRFGFLGKIDEKILEKFGMAKNLPVYFAQVYLEEIVASVKLERKFKPLPVFPSIRRDISLIVKKDISCEKIFKIIKEKGGKLINSVNLFDQYKGPPVPQDSIGLSFSLEYQSKVRTLTDEEVNLLHREIVAHLIKNLEAKIR